jgi:hypothetical protein
VYKGTWQGTEVAIKRFLDQNLSDAIRRDFKHEVDPKAVTCLRVSMPVNFRGSLPSCTRSWNQYKFQIHDLNLHVVFKRRMAAVLLLASWLSLQYEVGPKAETC